MAKKTRKSGVFDPDYRRQGWNQSTFAPKNRFLNITRLSILITAIPVVILVVIPESRKFLTTIQGFVILIIGVWVSWFLVAMLIRRWEWQRIQKRIAAEQPEPMSFETTSSPGKQQGSTGKIQPTAPMHRIQADPIQQQLAARKQRLQGQVEAHGMSPEAFEHEVAWVINETTPNKAVVTGGAGDGGVDIKVYDGRHYVGIVQCKRHDPNKALPPAYVRELATVKQQQGVEIAYLVTTAKISPATKHEANNLGIKIIDGDDYEKLRKQAQSIRHR